MAEKSMSAKRRPNKKLQHERITHGWSQEDVAAKLGVDVRTVRRWESGQPVRPYNIAGLTKLFGKSAEELGLLEDTQPEHAAMPQPAASAAIPDSFEYTLHFLPIPPTPLIGREQELAALKQMVGREEVRLLTLTGPGGIGKTRLGIQAAREVQDMFPDGIFFVDLAPIRNPALVIGTIAGVLGLQEAGGQPLLERLKAYLRPQQLLLLLDNFEQVVDAANQLAELLKTCPRLKLLVTSREVLRVQAEYEFPVPPLALPERQVLTEVADPAALLRVPAVALFVQRTQARKPDFQLTSASGAAVAEICVRLDGLPLAIELVAAKCKWLSPQALLSYLGRRLDIGERGLRDVPARQQTIYSSIAWSYELLNPTEQPLFRRLSVFVNGGTLEAAEKVCIFAHEKPFVLLDVVSSLIDKSLLQPLKQVEDEAPRIAMLETIREYGMKCLEESRELEAMQRAHAHYYLHYAEEAGSKLAGANKKIWLNMLESEQQNLRAALNWLLSRGSEEEETTLRLCRALWQFWRARGHISEGRNALAQALQQSKAEASSLRANVLTAAGVLAGLQGDYDQAEALCREGLLICQNLLDKQGRVSSLSFLAQIATWKSDYRQAHILGEEALAIAREQDDKAAIIATLCTLAIACFNEGNYARMYELAEEGLRLARAIDDTEGIARALWLLALRRYFQGEPTEAYALLTESLALAKELDDKGCMADALVVMAYITFFRGDHDAMQKLLDEAFALYRAVGDRRGRALCLYGQGWLALSRGNYAAAHACYEESLSILVELGHQWFSALCIEGLAYAASLQAQWVRSARLWSMAHALRERIGVAVPSILTVMYDRAIVQVRTQLGESDFTIAWAEGRMSSISLQETGHLTLQEGV